MPPINRLDAERCVSVSGTRTATPSITDSEKSPFFYNVHEETKMKTEDTRVLEKEKQKTKNQGKTRTGTSTVQYSTRYSTVRVQ